MKKIKVIYIAGTGRCGSTLLDSILSQMPGVFSCGELRYFWKRGIIQNRLCGTGEPFLTNPLWHEVVESLYGSQHMKYAKKFSSIESSLRLRKMFGFKTSNKVCYLKETVNKYSNELSRIIKAISSKSKSNFVIDSSKMPLHGFALSQISHIDLYIIHLVRNLKSVVHSWSTTKFDRGKNDFMKTQPVHKSSTEWVIINRLINRYLGTNKERYFRLNYEDLAHSPHKTISDILSFIDVPTKNNPIKNTYYYSISSLQPTISGNPVRFNNGDITIKEDLRWQIEMQNRNIIKAEIFRILGHALFFI